MKIIENKKSYSLSELNVGSIFMVGCRFYQKTNQTPNDDLIFATRLNSGELLKFHKDTNVTFCPDAVLLPHGLSNETTTDNI